MSHTDKIKDCDAFFEVNPITRQIINKTPAKIVLMQNDHDSERFTFSLPRYIEGHDMAESASAKLKYKNLANPEIEGTFPMFDLQIDPEDSEKVKCSWLISRNATKEAGAISFLIEFECYDDEELVYSWHTQPHNGISIGETFDCEEEIEEKYSDVLAQWELQINKVSQGISMAEMTPNRKKTIDNTADDKTYPSVKAVKDYVDSASELNTIVNTDEGSAINITDSANSKFRGLNLYGKTTQFSTTGKNLLPYPYVNTTITKNGVTFTDNGDGSITINGTATNTSYFVFVSTDAEFRKPIKAGTYYWSNPNTFSGVSTPIFFYSDKIVNDYTKSISINNTFTIETDMYYGCYISVASGTTVNNLTVYPMLEVGTTATEYEPYTGGKASPSVDYPQPLVNVGDGGSVVTKVYGKNLLTYPYVNTTITKNGITFMDNGDGSVTANGTATIDTYFELMNDKCRLKLNTGNYMLSGCPMGGAEKAYIVYTVDASDNSRVSTEYGNGRLFSVDGDKEYKAYIKVGSGTTVNNLTFKPQIEVGTVATEYEPYKETQTFTLNTPNGLAGLPVASNGNYTDENGQQWVCDEIDLARGKYVQRIGMLEVIKAGYQAVPSNGTTPYAAVYDIDRKEGVDVPLICTHYKFNGYNTTDGHIYPQKNKNGIVIRDSRFVDIDTANAILKEEKPKVLYELAEPIESALTEEEIVQYKTLTTYKPITNVFNDADAHMKVDYVADPKNYIDNKFNELQAAILSTGGDV